MIIVRSPLRVSLLGGSTDVRKFFSKFGGAVVSLPIQQYVYLCVNKSFDDRVRISYSKTEVVDSVDKLEHGIIREALKMFGVKKGIEIVTIADMPGSGTGLGSSSALAVGLMVALEQYTTGKPMTNSVAATWACRLEIDILKKPIGEQDQWGTALGYPKLIEWDELGIKNVTFCDPALLEPRLLLFYTGITRQSDDILVNQSHESKFPTLIQMKNLAEDGWISLLNYDWKLLGEQISASWYLKSTLDKRISNYGIDELINKAIEFGAEGAKLLGAGGGGFILVLADPEKHDDIRHELGYLREVPVKIDTEGVKVIYP